MGQIEVFQFLKDMRLSGDDSFFAIPQIADQIKDHKLYNQNPRGVSPAIITLEAYGYLDIEKPNKKSNYKRLFRLKDKYLK